MKIPLLLAAAFVILTGFSSCVREYTCQCTVTYTGQPGLPDSSLQEYPIKDTKKNAKSLCEANSYTSTESGITVTEKCELY